MTDRKEIRCGFWGIVLLLHVIQLSASAQNWTFIQFGKNEGLHHAQVLDISQDPLGNLWLGTATRSIYRFDGHEFNEFKIRVPGHRETLYAFKAVADASGRVWILSNIGLICFDGKTSRLIPETRSPTIRAWSSLVVDVNQTVWVIDARGDVFHMRSDSLVYRHDIHRELPNVIGCFLDKERMPTFYSRAGKLLSVSRKGNTLMPQIHWQSVQDVHSISRIGDTILVASSQGIDKFMPGKTIHIPFPDMKPTDRIHGITMDRNGVIWGLMLGRVFVVDRNNQLIWLREAGTLSNDAFSLFRDKEGNVWLALDPLGIVRHKEQSWIKRAGTEGFNVTCMAEDSRTGELIFGTHNSGVHGHGKNLLPGKTITALKFDSKGGLLAGTMPDGLYSITGNGASKIYPESSDPLAVQAVTAWKDTLLIGTPNGLIIRSDNIRPRLFKNTDPTKRGATVPLVINNTVLYASQLSGIMKVEGDRVVPVGPKSLQNSSVYGIQQMPNGGYCVFGEFSELIFFNREFKFLSVLDLSEHFSNVMVAEFIDSTRLIIGSHDGLFQVRFKNNRVTAVRKYGKVDGYNDDEPYVGASMRTRDGKILIGTVNGIYEFVEALDGQTPTASNAYITAVTLRGAEADSVSGFFHLPVNPRLRHDENHVTFSFASTNLSNPYNTRFRHRIEGLDEEWSSITPSHLVSYSNLPPGEYTFCVQAISDESSWGHIERYAFSVQPAFWQTNTFYLIAVLFLILTAIGIVQGASLRRLQKFKLAEQLRVEESRRLKKQMSMDFHDEMGNRLANMLTQASLLKLQHPQSSLYSAFDFFEKHAHAIYHGTKDFIWTIDVDSNRLSEVVIYLRDFGVNYFEHNNIVFHFECEISAKEFAIPLPDGANRQIILIVKEAMTNVLKHAEAENVHFSAVLDDGWMMLTVRDDGKGLSRNKFGNGLQNMRTRSNKIQGRLKVISEEGKGTAITLSVFVGHRL